jgi:hypothetical protein
MSERESHWPWRQDGSALTGLGRAGCFTALRGCGFASTGLGAAGLADFGFWFVLVLVFNLLLYMGALRGKMPCGFEKFVGLL